jgi:hypothetical protein
MSFTQPGVKAAVQATWTGDQPKQTFGLYAGALQQDYVIDNYACKNCQWQRSQT